MEDEFSLDLIQEWDSIGIWFNIYRLLLHKCDFVKKQATDRHLFASYVLCIAQVYNWLIDADPTRSALFKPVWDF